MIHKARHDNEKQVCETCKDFRRQIREVVHYFAIDLTALQAAALSGRYREPAVRPCGNARHGRHRKASRDHAKAATPRSTPVPRVGVAWVGAKICDVPSLNGRWDFLF